MPSLLPFSSPLIEVGTGDSPVSVTNPGEVIFDRREKVCHSRKLSPSTEAIRGSGRVRHASELLEGRLFLLSPVPRAWCTVF